MRLLSFSLLLMVSLALLQSGCSRDVEGASELQAQAEGAERPAGVEMAKPSIEKQAQAPALPESLSSWSGYMATLTDADQAFLSKMAMKYQGSLEYGSPVERARLARLGYPMPEALIAENKLTDDQLLTKARAGNLASKAVYAERIAQRIEVLELASGEKGLRSLALLDSAQQHELQNDANMAFAISAEALKLNPSPFTAYLYGRVSAVTAGTDIPTMSSIALARDLGDERATARLSTSDSDSQVSASAVLNNYESMRKLAGFK